MEPWCARTISRVMNSPRPESPPRALLVARSAAERFEDRGTKRFRNLRTLVAHHDARAAVLSFQTDVHGLLLRAVVESVDDEIRNDLLNSIGIPVGREVLVGAESDSPRVLRFQLLDGGGADVPQVGWTRLDPQSLSEPRAREVEELIDHPAHSLRTAGDAGKDVLQLGRHPSFERVEGSDDRVQRVAEVVPEYSEIEVADPSLFPAPPRAWP